MSADNESPSNKDKTEADAEASAVRKLTDQFQTWLKGINPEAHVKYESTIESMSRLADQGLGAAKTAMDMLKEFAQNLTGVESFKLIPRSSLALEVDIRCKQEQEVRVRQSIAPFVELESFNFGKHMHFEALINKEKKGLQLDINEGFSLSVYFPIVGMKVIPVQGSGILMHDEKGELVLITTQMIPGIDTPVTVSVPLKHFIKAKF